MNSIKAFRKLAPVALALGVAFAVAGCDSGGDSPSGSNSAARIVVSGPASFTVGVNGVVEVRSQNIGTNQLIGARTTVRFPGELDPVTVDGGAGVTVQIQDVPGQTLGLTDVIFTYGNVSGSTTVLSRITVGPLLTQGETSKTVTVQGTMTATGIATGSEATSSYTTTVRR